MKHSRTTAISQPNHSHDRHTTAESQPLRNRRSTSLFQALRNRKSICFEFWEFVDPFVAKAQNRRSTRFSTAESQSNYSHISKPDHSLCEIADPLVSGSDHNRITATPHTSHSRISTAAIAQPQPNHNIWEIAHPLVSGLGRSRSTAILQPESQPNHSHITAASEPDHSLWEIADPLTQNLWEIADPLASGSDRSGITALLQPNHSRRQPHETQPDHSHITAES